MADAKNETNDEKVIPVEDGTDKGYLGHVPDETPNEDYTVAGVTGGTAKATDTPKSASTSRSNKS